MTPARTPPAAGVTTTSTATSAAPATSCASLARVDVLPERSKPFFVRHGTGHWSYASDYTLRSDDGVGLVANSLLLCNAFSMFEDLLEANRRHALTFSLGGVPARAAKGFALVTCMDSRIEPLTMFGLRPGDAKILRNAGGRVTHDVLRSLVLATSFLGVTEIAVMQHTRCAIAGRSDESIRADLPEEWEKRAQGWEFLAMPDPDQALVQDVEAVRTCELLPAEVRVEGWRYSVDNGLVTRVVPS